ncbi:MAG: hypothetical protein Q9192_006944, partial [Flavoplaca navasiana]
MHDTYSITPRSQSLITCGNKTNSLESLTLQGPRQAAAKLHRRIREFLRQYGRYGTAVIFEGVRYKSDKNSFGELLAYLSSPFEKYKFDEPASHLYNVHINEMPSQFQFVWKRHIVAIRWKQLGQILPLRVQLKGATDAHGNQDFIRLEQIIMQTLNPRRHTAYPGCKSRLTHDQFQWIETNAIQATKCIEQWADWMRSNPYDKDGILTDRWKRRIRYFTSHHHKLGLLAESSPFEVWSMFLDPTWWMRLRTNYYGMTLRQIVNSPYMLSSVRTKLRLKYDASGYGRARKSSRLRKSIRAEVETATPQT